MAIRNNESPVSLNWWIKSEPINTFREKIVENSNNYSSLKAIANSKEDGFVDDKIMLKIDELAEVLQLQEEVAVLVRTNDVIKKIELIKEPNAYKKRTKLASFLISKGFESELVFKTVKDLEFGGWCIGSSRRLVDFMYILALMIKEKEFLKLNSLFI